MLGAAGGDIMFGALGDRIGRTQAMAVSILFYSVFSGAGRLVGSLEQMLALRFFVGLGVGGMWPNGMARLFGWSAVPGLLGVTALCFVPESPRWLSPRAGAARRAVGPLRELFRPPCHFRGCKPRAVQ
jgi:hypothetical protein